MFKRGRLPGLLSDGPTYMPLLWLAFMCTLLVPIEFVASQTRWLGGRWYPDVIEQLQGLPVRYLFVGSSRVSAAVDGARLEQALRGSGDSTTVNVGQGFSTIITHALGLRELGDQGLLRGSVVFLEAPQGMPDASTWHDEWYYIEAPYFLLTVMHAHDLPGLWRSNMSAGLKFAATGRLVFAWSRSLTYRERVRAGGLAAAYTAAQDLQRLVVGAGPSADMRAAEERGILRAGGGVRIDIDDRQRIRAAAADEGRRMVATQRVVDDWDASVVGDIVRLVRRAGGDVVFYEMPLSSVMRGAYETPTGISNVRSFRRQAAEWRTPILALRRSFPDEEFPDLWHLSREQSVRFTDDLVLSWQKARRPGEPLPPSSAPGARPLR